MSARGKSHQKRRATAPASPTITLQNPVADHYETWIIGNAVAWQVRAMAELEDLLTPDEYAALRAIFDASRPGLAYGESKAFHDAITDHAMAEYMVTEGSAKGQHLVLCGAGPSLAEDAATWCPQGDQVWGCNSAATWLYEHGHRVTHAFTVDQTPHMCAEWASAPPIEYLIATTVHPHLTALLTERSRRWRFFHNFVGIAKPPVSWPGAKDVPESLAYEDWLYALLFPPTVRSGSGLNAVTRAIDVAQFMGFDKITILGADCCLRVKGEPRTDFTLNSPEHQAWLREHTVMHADGGHALSSEASPLTLSATIDGRYWMTKVDMVITAQWLVRMARASEGRIALIGDTLPNALIDKDEAFLQRLPNFVTPDGQLANIPVFSTRR